MAVLLSINHYFIGACTIIAALSFIAGYDLGLMKGKKEK